MYTITSTAGLACAVPTAEQAGALLGRHLQDLGRDGPIRWRITTPLGAEQTGTYEFPGWVSADLLADVITAILADLRDQERATPGTESAGRAAEPLCPVVPLTPRTVHGRHRRHFPRPDR